MKAVTRPLRRIMIKKWDLVKSERITSNRVFSTRKDAAVSPVTGEQHDFFVIEAPDWVNIVALTGEGDRDVVLIRQYRHGIRSETVEIPGGMIDPGETPLEAARRELLEETGYASDEWVDLGAVVPNPAIQNNRCPTFLARSAKKIEEPRFDTTEDIATYTAPLSDVPGLIGTGKITHSLVICAFYLLSIAE